MRSRTHRYLLVALLESVIAVGCSNPPTAPVTGTLTVRVTTIGVDADSNGYVATVDGRISQAIGPNGSVTFRDLDPGSHTLDLGGVAPNCTTIGYDRVVKLPAAGGAVEVS